MHFGQMKGFPRCGTVGQEGGESIAHVQQDAQLQLNARKAVAMAYRTYADPSNPLWPSRTGNPSGGGRGNNPPAKK